MRYDKSGKAGPRRRRLGLHFEAWQCTDFHSLFIGMMRSSGIPARFEIVSAARAKTEATSRLPLLGRVLS